MYGYTKVYIKLLSNISKNIGSYDHVKDFSSNVLDDFKTEVLAVRKSGTLYFLND